MASQQADAPGVAGTMFRVENNQQIYFCSASVVSSPKRNLVLTAGHCLTGRETANQLAFAPKIQKNAQGGIETPYGKFPIKRQGNRALAWMDQRYLSWDKQAAAQFDVAFAEADKGTNGKEVEDTVGGNRLATNTGFAHKDVHLVGYPGADPPPRTCTADTTEAKFSGWPGSYLRIDCDGYSGGSSGAPFIANFNTNTQTGDVIGVIGGYKTGGPTPDTSYSSYFGTDIKNLYDSAVRGDKPASAQERSPSAASPTPPSPVPSSPTRPASPSPAPTTATPKAVPSPRPYSLARWNADDVDAFLTPERMASAKPWPEEGKQNNAVAAKTLASFVPSQRFEGLPVAGTMFRVENNQQIYFCSASVVSSPKRNLVLTAGHCLTGRETANQLAFAPKIQKNAQGGIETPYGKFPIKRQGNRALAWMDQRYLSWDKQAAAQFDVAFAEADKGTNGKEVEDTVGGNRLATNTGFAHKDVHLVGYPGADPPPRTCTADTTEAKFSGWPGSYLRIDCDGYSGGSSGAPFIANFNTNTQTGDVIGVIGGYKTGGPTPDTSYSSYFGTDIKNLYDSAVRGDKPATGGILGKGETWKYARGIASGYFTTESPDYTSSDMVVRWADGEVTLYIGDGDGNFEKEIQLAAPNETWKHADVITAGDFTGTDLYDLMVRWSDGEVTIYKDVSEQNKLSQEIQIEKPATDSIWKHAVSLATGHYAGNKWPDDVIVRWTDGEVTLYTDVDQAGFHKESQLSRPAQDSIWKNAVLVTGGDFDGDHNIYDVAVRWADGSLTLYTNVDESGFHQSTQIVPANDLWANHSTLMIAGDFSENAWQDDLIMVWTDGEVSLFMDTSASALGHEYMLVSPDKSLALRSQLPVRRGLVSAR
ncbi:trypsin-like serine peptidase [Streptomyces sp. BR1]|uniref:trypsin-like serine peptidase n=1 Tax=Streptomyces sp. BR1 TaxID=1592323 RepID=UPI00402BEC3D